MWIFVLVGTSGVFGGDRPVLEVIGTGGEIYEALVSLSGLECGLKLQQINCSRIIFFMAEGELNNCQYRRSFEEFLGGSFYTQACVCVCVCFV